MLHKNYALINQTGWREICEYFLVPLASLWELEVETGLLICRSAKRLRRPSWLPPPNPTAAMGEGEGGENWENSE